MKEPKNDDQKNKKDEWNARGTLIIKLIEHVRNESNSSHEYMLKPQE